MLLNINCSAIASIKVNLTFDDGSTKERVVGVGDLVVVDYNANGLRHHIEGCVVAVSANGTDPNGWYIIVDCSDDFSSNKAKFSPMSILDIEIIRKADTLNVVQTVVGEEGIPYIRIVKGQLQYSKDGYRWHPIHVRPRDIIYDAEGTVPDVPPCPPIPPHYSPKPCACEDSGDEGEGYDGYVEDENAGGIEDANW